ncbi:unnamed protein product [Larinioides sclopetarius]|uniref:RRM domain-containing protein n=1 Tax=Larinioides sclopetarius TaxID=280406 RepID=A0AAV1ZY45_9ARAC
MTMTDSDDVGKLFVGGLSWETTKETLQNYFSQFGEVVDSVVMKNNETGRSRGFGFVTFKDPICVNAVLQSKPHEINGRTVDAKECTPRSMQKNKRAATQGKVFLGGLPPDITETDIRSSLSKFGKVECKRAEPRDTNQRRNPAQGYNSGNQNGMRPGGYGPAPGYQANWNQPAQPYGMQGQGYGNYQNYNAMGTNSYSAGTAPYSAMPPSTQYAAQPSYSGYGAVGYGYAQPPAAGNYSQPSAGGYSQAPAASYPPAAAAAPDALNAYPQNPPAFGPAKAYGSSFPKDQTSENGPNYQAPAANRNQGYHPYRR